MLTSVFGFPETLRLVKAFQFTDKHGEVCPIDWKEGSETIKATPKDSLEYFSTANAKTNGVNGHAHANGNGMSP